MLHGCTQNPEDFVTGTRMIAEAERAGLILLVPEQGRGDNPQLCWNWFRPGDQQGGEAAKSRQGANPPIEEGIFRSSSVGKSLGLA